MKCDHKYEEKDGKLWCRNCGEEATKEKQTEFRLDQYYGTLTKAQTCLTVKLSPRLLRWD